MVDGYAVGAGSNLALSCDLIVASDRARFGELFCKIGLAVDGGGTWFLPRLVGLPRAKALVFTGDIIDAAEAHRIGIVNRVGARRRAPRSDARAGRQDRGGAAAGAAP
jgi:2-(1,2-epoxy-1,2-dihydrophenyl)acetyl-CoA isomerase